MADYLKNVQRPCAAIFSIIRTIDDDINQIGVCPLKEKKPILSCSKIYDMDLYRLNADSTSKY